MMDLRARIKGFDPETQKNILLVQEGIDAEEFLSSTIGKNLVERGRLIAEAAMQELKERDPTDAKGITELQNLIRWGEAFGQFIREMAEIGRIAEEAIRTSEGD